MDTNDEVRRRRLRRLCADKPGGIKDVAAAAAVGWESLDQILKKVLLPTKSDGTRRAKALGDDLARKIEAAYSLPLGWLDWPLDAVDYALYLELSEVNKGAAQTRMMAAIEKTITHNHLQGKTRAIEAAVTVQDETAKLGINLAASGPGKPKASRVVVVTHQGTKNNDMHKTKRVQKQGNN